MIFNEFIRTDNSHKGELESTYQFLDRSSWSICSYARDLLNKWVEPFVSDPDFMKKIKSFDDQQFNGAMFELMFFRIIKKLNLEIIRNTSSSRLPKPDFEISTKKNDSFFIECTLAADSFESVAEKKRKSAVKSIIEDLHYFPYFINLSFRKIGLKSVSKRKLLSFIKKLAEDSAGIDNDILFHQTNMYNEEGWQINITISRKSNKGIKRSLGHFGGGAKMVVPQKSLFNSLNAKKPNRYSLGEKPYLIALNSQDIFLDENSWSDALFGPNLVDSIRLDFDMGNGIYYSKRRPVNSSISAVIFFKNFSIFSLSSAEGYVYHNPFAKHKLSSGILPFPEYEYEKVDNRTLSRTELKKFFSFFDLLDVNEELYKDLISKRPN